MGKHWKRCERQARTRVSMVQRPTRGRDSVLGSGKKGWSLLSCFTHSQACVNTTPSCLKAESANHGVTTLDQDSSCDTCTHAHSSWKSIATLVTYPFDLCKHQILDQ